MKLYQRLRITYHKKEEIWLTDQAILRKLVGISGLLLPLLLFVFLYIYSCYPMPLESISHYYYTRVGSIFVIVMSLLAIFLLIYTGKAPIDFYISSIAGIFALCVVLFPTDAITIIPGNYCKEIGVSCLPASPFRETFHFISAGIFLSCLAIMSLFIFTKSDHPPKNRPREKKIRNRIFRTCGILMILSMSIIACHALKIIPNTFFTENHLTFWMETTAVVSFGISWLIKGYS